jgi:mannose-6-phosphate isomerase
MRPVIRSSQPLVMLEPVLLEANAVGRFYRGGPRIAAFRGSGAWGDREPEDWIGSCTCVLGEPELGLARLPDGRTVREAVAADAVGYLGREHVDAFGADPGLLVKLLDAGERLPVHWHPDRAFARRHLGSRYGKTEAWVVLEADEAAAVHVGFSRDVARAEAESWLRDQDVDAMLGAMHRRPVAAGDTVLVPAGTPHAIGEGILLVELQEPTDLSVLLEWRGFSIDGEREGHLGIGFDLALDSLRFAAVAEPELARWGTVRGERCFPAEADRFFRADRVGPGRAAFGPSFAILVVTGGEGVLRWAGGSFPLWRGATVLVPFAAGPLEVEGVSAIRCRAAERPPDA